MEVKFDSFMNEKKGIMERMVVLSLYLLHYPDFQTNVYRVFSDTFKKHDLKNIPKSLGQQPHINSTWKQMQELGLIVPVLDQQEMTKSIKYEINKELFFQFDRYHSPLDKYIVNVFSIMISELSYITPEKRILLFDKIRNYDYLTLFVYFRNLINSFCSLKDEKEISSGLIEYRRTFEKHVKRYVNINDLLVDNMAIIDLLKKHDIDDFNSNRKSTRDKDFNKTRESMLRWDILEMQKPKKIIKIKTFVLENEDIYSTFLYEYFFNSLYERIRFLELFIINSLAADLGCDTKI